MRTQGAFPLAKELITIISIAGFPHRWRRAGCSTKNSNEEKDDDGQKISLLFANVATHCTNNTKFPFKILEFLKVTTAQFFQRKACKGQYLLEKQIPNDIEHNKPQKILARGDGQRKMLHKLWKGGWKRNLSKLVWEHLWRLLNSKNYSIVWCGSLKESVSKHLRLAQSVWYQNVKTYVEFGYDTEKFLGNMRAFISCVIYSIVWIAFCLPQRIR